MQNFRTIGDKNFFDIERSPLWIFQKIYDFLNDVRGKWSAGLLNLTFHMVISVASRPKIHGHVNIQSKKGGGGTGPPSYAGAVMSCFIKFDVLLTINQFESFLLGIKLKIYQDREIKTMIE